MLSTRRRLLLASALLPTPLLAGKAGVGRVLFVGNSQLYVGNAPAVFAALSAQGKRPLRSDMMVAAGATLAQRLADGALERALAAQHYAAVVLQERGGDLLGAFGPEALTASRRALLALAALARRHALRLLLLGSYQGDTTASGQLVAAESAAAAEAGIAYVELSETLRRLRTQAPDLHWFAEDGMHPGKDLALLAAMRVHQALWRELPPAQALHVPAPIYGINSGLSATLRAADAPPPRTDTPLGHDYPAATLRTLRRGIGGFL